jgi:hypothetical protein
MLNSTLKPSSLQGMQEATKSTKSLDTSMQLLILLLPRLIGIKIRTHMYHLNVTIPLISRAALYGMLLTMYFGIMYPIWQFLAAKLI